MEEKPTSLQVLLQRFGRDHGNHVGESSQGEGTHTDRGPKALSGPITWQSNTITLAATRLKKKKKRNMKQKSKGERSCDSFLKRLFIPEIHANVYMDILQGYI